ncbi:glycosyltransferase family 31 protein [Xylaria bambusicola]|uniref:glycosyltransferase family 31 protein n=1 Tax=Xylaria bambusicola TaxID=326684 RepID=UPI002008189B|nr:glycosyltransferase family 31 protein [Xylaria bambusicola]KAI0517281.1 glycosyltransferase family 31 protein [Xylaria bambusicola]
MGANRSSPHQRLFTMRNPVARCVVVAVVLLVLLAVTWKSEKIENVGTQIIKATATHNKGTHIPQQPLGDVPQTGDLDIPPVSNHKMDCSVDGNYMAQLKTKYELMDNFQYFKRYVKINRQPIKRKSITLLDQEFLPGNVLKNINLQNPNYGNEKCIEPLNVYVPESPYPATGNLSDFMFGVSTTFKRFSGEKTSPVNEWIYWLTDGKGNSNGGKLILLLLDATEEQITHARTVLRNAGIDVDVYHSDSTMEMAVRYLTLIPTLYNHPDRRQKKWLVSCDDDTFFPSVHKLVQKFEEYDPHQQLYIGVLSEDINNVDRHGSQAFGGAGVFLSVPLAEQITRDYETCKTDEKIKESNSGWGPQGDILLRKCIYENTDVRLSVLHGLYQLDLYGDPSGFYEAGLSPISLHHFKGGGWHSAMPWEYTKVAHICGEDCTFLRFQTSDDFIISTGFSVAHYPLGVDFNLQQMERTFAAAPQDKGWNLDYVFDPQRPSLLKTGRKISWDLQEATVTPDNTIRQVFVRKANDWRWVDKNERPMSQVDGVIELVWIP